MTFEEYVRDLDLQRVEGLVLRYLSDAYKVLTQTVPEPDRTDEILGMIDYFGSMVRGIDASLLEEWERMRRPGRTKVVATDTDQIETPDITRDRRQFTVLVRNAVFRLLRLLSGCSYAEAVAIIHAQKIIETPSWTAEMLEAVMAPYYEDHAWLATDQKARDPALLRIDVKADVWMLEQTLTDPDLHNDWQMLLIVDLEQSRQSGAVALDLLAIRPI
jgi:Domain of unknown function (DUF3516)